MKTTKHILKAALLASVMAFSAGAVLAEGATRRCCWWQVG